MLELPSLDELEEEHWSIVVLAHRLAEAVAISQHSSEIPELIELLCQRCNDHFHKEEAFVAGCDIAMAGELLACQHYLRDLLNRLRPTDGTPVNGLAAIMTAVEAALIMTLQHDRALLSALHGLPPPREQSPRHGVIG